MEQGDVAVARRTRAVRRRRQPETAPHLRIHPGRYLRTVAWGTCRLQRPARGPDVRRSCRTGEAMVVSGTYQLDGDVSRRLLTALPSVLVVPAADVAGLGDGDGARRDPARRTGPAERARPVARPGADHHAAGLVRAAGVARARVVPGAERSGRRTRVALAARGSGVPVERHRAGGPRRGITSQPGPPLHRAGRRGTDDATSPAGGSPSPPTCSARPPTRSRRSPAGSATRTPSPSASPSNESAAPAPQPTAAQSGLIHRRLHERERLRPGELERVGVDGLVVPGLVREAVVRAREVLREGRAGLAVPAGRVWSASKSAFGTAVSALG